MIDWSLVKLGSSASLTASSEIAVIDDQNMAKAEMFVTMLTAMGYCSLPQEEQRPALVFQVTRVSSFLPKVLRGV